MEISPLLCYSLASYAKDTPMTAPVKAANSNTSSKHGFYLEDLEVGQSAEYSRAVTKAMIETFAEISGDDNPVHLDPEFAKTTIFKDCIAHGMLCASFISRVLGVQLPGPGTIYLGQNLKFKAPVKIGDTVVARCEITEIVPEKRRVVLKTTATVNGNPVIEGEATVMVDSRSQ
jgi:3-hydroxybutyryl-CoA dehydratase